MGGAAAACAPTRATAFEGEAKFLHGVASGDPAADAVVIWTRVSTTSGGAAAPVRWVVSRDRKLRRVVQDGEVTTDASRDFTVKVDVGGLEPGTRYYFGFVCGRSKSPIGRTRTLPAKATDKVVFAVCSCSHYGFGFFNGYAEIAKRDDLDAVLHLGDYIYEYGVKAYGGEVGVKLGRAPIPPSEIVSLADYRARHAQYKTDPDLQAAHAAAPWIVTWDDHETTNDSWRHGAENHQPNEGDWDDRKRAALQAYFEWMPIREPKAGRPWEAIDRSFQFGDLVTLLMLETRLLARDHQLDYATDLAPRTMAWNMDARPPRPVAAGETIANARVLPIFFDVAGAEPKPITEWAKVSALDPKALPAGVAILPDLQGFLAKLNDSKRALMGPDQLAWVKDTLRASTAAGVTWQVFGNQVLMGKVNAPDLSAMPEPVLAQLEKLSPRVREFVRLTKLGLPLNLDAWDGYPAERERLLQLIAESRANAIVVTGDTHTAWANHVRSPGATQPMAVEFGATSITSPGFGDLVKIPSVDIGDLLKAKNPETVIWTDQVSRGFIILTLTRNAATAEFHQISTILDRAYKEEVNSRFSVKPIAGPGIGAIEKA
jgi:alkaline phosphatase D